MGAGHEGPKKKGHPGKAGGVGRALQNAKKARSKRNRLELVREEEAEKASNIAAATESVTAQSSLQDFLVKAEMADADFTAVRNNFQLVSVKELPRMVAEAEEPETKRMEVMMSHADALRIPRRPAWNEETTSEELMNLENTAFLEWRRRLAEIEEQAPLCLTPFERNIELWRQLWRVLERSQVLLQIVDARNPLLFRSADLERYAKELDPPRPCLLLLNKADLLTIEQRQVWADYLTKEGIPSVFWSAVAEVEEEEVDLATEWRDFKTSTQLYSTNALLSLLRSIGTSIIHGQSSLTVGCVGYPNVGKSSTINRIIGSKKVAVSATPGKTRHFQTLHVESDLCLCDCPGLVMPSFSFSRDEMLLNGILPAATMRSFAEPISLLCRRFPSHHLQSLYGISLPPPQEGAPLHLTTPADLLTSLAFLRGYMSSKGVPDSSRAARILVKDVVSGKLCWVSPPPTFQNPSTFNVFVEKPRGEEGSKALLDQLKRRHLIQTSSRSKVVDDEFFAPPPSAAKILDPRTRNAGGSKKHGNAKAKQKLRRIYGQNDVC